MFTISFSLNFEYPEHKSLKDYLSIKNNGEPLQNYQAKILKEAQSSSNDYMVQLFFEKSIKDQNLEISLENT